MGDFFVYSFFIGTLITLLPVFVRIDGYSDLLKNKFFFSVSLYGIIPVVGGYSQLTGEGVVTHISRKKAVIVPYAKMKDTQKRFEITKGFQLYSFRQVVETGNVHAPSSVLLATLLRGASGQIFSVIKTKHPFVTLKNTTILAEERVFKLSFRVVTVFNGMVLSSAITKKILEELISWWKRKKLKTSWKRRHSS